MSNLITDHFIHLQQPILPILWPQCFKYGYPSITFFIPHNLLFFKYFIIKSMYSNCFVLLLFIYNIILYTSTNDVPSFLMWNHHQKLTFYQIHIIFHLDLTYQVMNILLFLVIILNNILTLLLCIIQDHDILLYLKVGVPIFTSIFFQRIRQYILNKNKSIKTQIHTLFKNATSFIYRIPINIRQLTFLFWGGVSYTVSFDSWIDSSLEYTHYIDAELISLILLYLNLTRYAFFPTASWKNPTTSLLILLILPYLVFSSISATFYLMTDTTPIFALFQFTYFVSFMVVTTCKICWNM